MICVPQKKISMTSETGIRKTMLASPACLSYFHWIKLSTCFLQILKLTHYQISKIHNSEGIMKKCKSANKPISNQTYMNRKCEQFLPKYSEFTNKNISLKH